MLIQDPLFDLDQLARDELLATPWTGAPLGYTADYWTPTEFDAALARYQAEHGRSGSIPRSHMWHTTMTCPPLTLVAHELHVYVAAAHCDLQDHDHSAAPLPQQHLYQGQLPAVPLAPDPSHRARRGRGLARPRDARLARPAAHAGGPRPGPRPPTGHPTAPRLDPGHLPRRVAIHRGADPHPPATAMRHDQSQDAARSAATTWRRRNEGAAP